MSRTDTAIESRYRGKVAMTVPLDGVPLADQKGYFENLQEWGYSELWSAEAMGVDGFTPLALASVWCPSMRLGTAIIPAFTRGPALLAQQVAAMASAAPGRFTLGIGSSSNVIVERWNATPFERPYQRVQATVRFLRRALAGEKITDDFGEFEVRGFRLGLRVSTVPILVAALREQMLKLAGSEGDGAIINWLGADEVPKVAGIVRDAADKAGRVDPEIVARIFVIPSEDRELVVNTARFAIAAYLNVPVYADFHRWLGNSALFEAMWERWSEGDRSGALGQIGEEAVDRLVVSGSPEQCQQHIQRYLDNGVSTAVLAVLPAPGLDVVEAARVVAPSSTAS